MRISDVQESDGYRCNAQAFCYVNSERSRVVGITSEGLEEEGDPAIQGTGNRRVVDCKRVSFR